MRYEISKRSFCFILIAAGFLAASRAMARTTITAVGSERVLTAARLKSLENLLAQHGKNIKLYASPTAALGITKPGNRLTLRQLNIILNPDKSSHVYQRMDDGRFLFIVLPAGKAATNARYYLVSADETLVAAVEQMGPDKSVTIPFAQAQNELSAEMAFWADVADKP